MEPLFNLSLYEPPFQAVQLVHPCGACRRREIVKARYLVARNVIEALCPCGARYALDQRTYADVFPEIPKKQRRHRHNHDDAEFIPTDPPYRIFNRYGYRCVYHEGSEEAKRLRLSQVDALATRAPQVQTTLAIDSPALRRAVIGEALDERSVRNLFGLVPDHLIPRSFTRRFEAEMTERQRLLCKQEWIVAACVQCNEERGATIETADSLLFIYSRFVMPHRGRTAFDRLSDARDFLGVLDILARGILTKKAQPPTA